GLLQHLGDQEQHAVLVFDMMGAKKLMMRKPRNLYDAWVQSIMVPLAEISKDDLEVFRFKYQPKNMDLVHISLTKHVPENHWPFVLDWSYSNLASLYAARVGLLQEPFVAGADTMIVRVVADIPDAERGFTLIFSASPFPGNQYRLDWHSEETGGNWYHSEELK